MSRDAIFVGPLVTIKDALKRLDETAKGTLVVVDEEMHLLGTLTDGDVRRWILRGKSIEDTIESAFNTNPSYVLDSNFSEMEMRGIFAAKGIDLVPILDPSGRVTRFAISSDYMQDHGATFRSSGVFQEKVPVVVMAGGKGTRLAPFTTVLPKPLIPIGERTILELIISEFIKCGLSDFHFTLNYRGEMIRSYFDGIVKDYNLSYLWEKEFYGTAGSLLLAKPFVDKDVFVSNCDIIVKADFLEVFEFHRSQNACMTLISSFQHHQVPYGIVDFGAGGVVECIREKPEFTFPINTGVYLLSREALDYIPEGQVFHMTHLVETLISNGKKVLTYPVNEKDYIDIGQWDEYHSVIARMRG